MEPVIAFSLLENVEMLMNGMKTLRIRCIDGISAIAERCKDLVMNSISLVTALNPYLGYEVSTKLAKEALETGESVYYLILKQGIMEEERLKDILKPENMIKLRKMNL